MRKEYYYSDPLNDDFANNNIKTRPLSESYVYERGGAPWRFLHRLIYSGIARPVVFAALKTVWRQRFVNRKALKSVKGGYYVYVNHTAGAMDAFLPNIADSRDNSIVVGPDAMSLKGLNALLYLLGAIPMGSSIRQLAGMKQCILSRVARGETVTIYPEGHIWPYYTDIRDFSDSSFMFPAADRRPVFTFTNCYSLGRLLKYPKVTTYIDGPFFPPEDMSPRSARKYLRDACYAAMKKRCGEYSTYEYAKYIYIDKEPKENEKY